MFPDITLTGARSPNRGFSGYSSGPFVVCYPAVSWPLDRHHLDCICSKNCLKLLYEKHFMMTTNVGRTVLVVHP